MRNVLFVCGRNLMRSPTAETIFAAEPGLEVASAGLDRDSRICVDPELVEWADIIFVMERAHRRKLSDRFQPFLKNTRVVCLDIPDEYEFMDPDLVRLLEVKVGRHLRLGNRHGE